MLDGLGWDQLAGSAATWRPTLAAMEGGADHHVAPSTTATALTLDRHRPARPASTASSATASHVRRRGPQRPALADAGGRRPPASSRPTEFQPDAAVPRRTGRRSSPGPSSPAPASRGAHLDGVRFTGTGCRRRSSTEVAPRCCAAGEPFVYAYYDGIDKVAHEYGLGDHYDAELAGRRPPGRRPPRRAAARRGAGGHRRPRPGRCRRRHRRRSTDEVHGPRVLPVGRGPVPLAARPARARRRPARPRPRPPRRRGAWVRTRDQIDRRGLVRAEVTDAAAARLGDVALVARDPVAFDDPADTGPYHLIGRHGSLTAGRDAACRCSRRVACRDGHDAGRSPTAGHSARRAATRRPRSMHVDPTRRPSAVADRRVGEERPSRSTSRPRSCGSAR